MSSVGVSKADKIGQYGVQASICCLFKFAVFVCVCVCVCVCLYSSTVKASPTAYLRGTDHRCYAVSIIVGASAKFVHLHF